MGNGHEDQISWRWKATDNIALTPAFTIESTDSRTIYKPNLHVQYSFDNGFYVAARYRYEYTRYPSSSNKDDDKVNRGDAWVGWVLGDWRTELNYVYAKVLKAWPEITIKIIPTNITPSWLTNGIKLGAVCGGGQRGG